MHVFIKYLQPMSWKKILKSLQDLKVGGRVHIRYGKSEFNACKKYLVDPDKDKKLDSDVIVNVTKLSLVEKYPQESDKCRECGVLFYNPSPFRCLPDMFRADKCFKCSDGVKSFKDYLKKFSQDNISQDGVCSS